jgi:GTP-binding protein EngB required for normal cell division
MVLTMSDPNRISNYDLNEQLHKRDLEIILEVNKKAIEIETGVADQNEEIVSLLTEAKSNLAELENKTDKIIKQNDELSKDIFKLQVLFVTGLLSLIVQVVQIFLRK